MIESVYRQYVHEGGYRGAAWYLRKSISSPREFCFEHFDYLRLVSVYHELFGRNRVNVLPYESLLNDQRQFIAAFCDAIGPGVCVEGRIPESGPVNRGYSWPSICAARCMNAVIAIARTATGRRGPIHSSWTVRRFRKFLQERVDPVLRRSERSPEWSLPATIRAAIKARYRESNQYIVEEYGLPLQQYGYATLDAQEDGDDNRH